MRMSSPSGFAPRAALLVALIAGCQRQQLAPEVEYVAPELRVEGDALWRPVGTGQVHGIARNVSNVTVNGQAATVSEGSFTANVNLGRGVNLLDARALDGRGDELYVRQGVLAGEFASPDVPIADAIAIRVNRGGLAKVTDLVGGYIDPPAIGAAATALNPVYVDSYGVFGWDAVNVEANLLNLEFSPPVISADPRPGVMALEIAIPNVEVHIGVDGDVVGLDFSQDAWIGADLAVVNAHVVIDAVDGQLEVEMIAPTVSLNGFWYDTSLIPGDVESFLLVDTIRDAVEGMLLTQIEALVPSLLDDTLSELDLSFQTELLGKQVGVGTSFSDAFIDAAGVQLVADLSVIVPGDTGRPWLGYLAAPVAEARPSYADDLGMALSDDLLNNLLFQAWRSGILSLDLDSARGDINPVLLSQLGATDAARVVVDAHLPPVVVQHEGGLQVQVTELAVRVETPDGENGEYLDLSVTAKIPVELRVEAGILKIALGTPEVVVDVRDSDWGASNNAIGNLLADQLPIATLVALLGDIEFPLPSFAGITLGDTEAIRDSSGVYTTVGVNL